MRVNVNCNITIKAHGAKTRKLNEAYVASALGNVLFSQINHVNTKKRYRDLLLLQQLVE